MRRPAQTRARSVDQRSFGADATEGLASMRGREPTGRFDLLLAHGIMLPASKKSTYPTRSDSSGHLCLTTGDNSKFLVNVDNHEESVVQPFTSKQEKPIDVDEGQSSTRLLEPCRCLGDVER